MPTCGCTLKARCREAWALRDQFAAIPLDGSAHQRHLRLDVVRTLSDHLRTAGLFYVHMGRLDSPLWDEYMYDDPRRKEFSP